MNDVFQERFELKIGKIVEVSGNSLRIEIEDNVREGANKSTKPQSFREIVK
jgi:ribosomal protein L21E